MFQTRSEKTGLDNHPTFEQAHVAALEDVTIWKISFSIGEERVRLLRFGTDTEPLWKYEPILFPETTNETSVA